MAAEALKLFYSYATEDEELRNQLEKHLTILQHQGYITQWHDGEVSAGAVFAKEIHENLLSANIILLLVSSDFLASNYCYGVEMQEAIRRHLAGEATVIPVILRPTHWKGTPFAELTPLPKGGKAVTSWPNQDAAFQNIVEGICRIVEKARQEAAPTKTYPLGGKKKDTLVREGTSVMDMPTVPKTPILPPNPEPLNASSLRKSIGAYYKVLKGYEGKAEHEMALRSAFQYLLANTAHDVNWTLIPEQTIEDGIRPDGVMRDINNIRRGYWEAKGPGSNLDKEIAEKIRKGYPLNNTIFENTIRAILYQNNNKYAEYDLRKSNDVNDLLIQFFTHSEPHIDRFQTAVIEFKKRIPALANDLLGVIENGHQKNPEFKTAFVSFAEICRSSLNPNLSDRAINEMLVQHLLTERLFRTIFNNPDFIKRNIIAAEIEKVIQALTIHSFNRQDFFQRLDRYYVAIEGTAKGITSWNERQEFLNTVYEGFFQGFSTKQADVHGIVYTPQEIVDFMCASVEEVLKSEFDMSIADPGVKILDPATGTGNFIVNLIRKHIPGRYLREKYKNDLFCNEIMLLPYYIASLNIEHEYYVKTGEYIAFEGICFADTLELAAGQQLSLFVEENTERIQREKDAEIMVVIGNPPYNVGQTNENDNNKNRKYSIIDQHIRETYVKGSKATLNTQLYDAYVRFFRWATDRLGNSDGIICLVSNNSFVDQITFDGMRQHLLKDFSCIYHIDLHGNVRRNLKLSGTTHNIFGIQVGVGITIAIRLSKAPQHTLYYHRVPEYWRRTEKLAFLMEKGSISNIDWKELHPDEKYNWLTEGLQIDFSTSMPLGTKEAKTLRYTDSETLFKTYSTGINSGRDSIVYDFNHQTLEDRINQFSEDYNAEISRWVRNERPKDIDNFVRYERIKWSRNLKRDLQHERNLTFDTTNIRQALYRPFTKLWLYYSDIIIDEQGTTKTHFPNKITETENIVICVPGLGNRRDFGCLATNTIPSMDLAFEKVQSFPMYIYSADGNNRRENITDWSLTQFQSKYGPEVTKWDIFHYVYGLLHHPQYRERYAENLKRDLPHIPLLHTSEAFLTCVSIGRQLMDLHINYEQAKEYKKLEWLETKDVPLSYEVEKMRLSTDRRVVVVNESLRLGPVPEECFEYRLGNRSALEWVIDQYQVSEDKRSGIKSDPNRYDDPEYIVRLVGKVVTVSVETVRLVKELAQAITTKDWLDEVVETGEPIETTGDPM